MVIQGCVIAEVLDRVPSDDADHVRLGSGVLTAGLVSR